MPEYHAARRKARATLPRPEIKPTEAVTGEEEA